MKRRVSHGVWQVPRGTVVLIGELLKGHSVFWSAIMWVLNGKIGRKYGPLFSQAGSHDVSAFLNQKNHNHPFFLHELIAFYEQASSRNFLTEGLILVNVVNLEWQEWQRP